MNNTANWENSLGGYDTGIFIMNEKLQNYKCALCDKILKDAVQIPQSQNPRRACRLCYTQNTKYREGICPIFGTHDTTHYPDKFADREVRELHVICSNKENGCPWTDKLSLLEKHLQTCQFRTVLCEYCKKHVLLFKHDEQCPEMVVVCEVCGKSTLRKKQQEHNRYCQMRRTFCECGEAFLPAEIPSKILTHWPHQTKCIYSYIGCEEMLHNDESNHAPLIVSKLVELEQNNLTLEQNNQELDIRNKQLEKMVQGSIDTANKLQSIIDNLTEKYNTVHENFETLKEEVRKLNENSGEQMPILGGGLKLKKDVDEMKNRMSNFEEKTTTITKSINDLDLKFQLQENKTMDGELIWKIDKVQTRMSQARTGKMVALHSAPCFTGQYQYKFCTRLYLYGDGMGRSTHVSIFFVVMKSEYDDLLQWPMRKRIKFELINHANESENVVESFVSNATSSSFQRPQNNMNVAAGCPMFIPIEQFLTGGFTKGDCAYIRTTVRDVQ